MDQTLAKYYTPHLKILSNLLRPYLVLDYFAIRAIWQGKQVVQHPKQLRQPQHQALVLRTITGTVMVSVCIAR